MSIAKIKEQVAKEFDVLTNQVLLKEELEREDSSFARPVYVDFSPSTETHEFVGWMERDVSFTKEVV